MGFMKKITLKDDTMKESEIQKVYNYPMFLWYLKIFSDTWFVIIDNGSMEGTHWTCFNIKDN